MEVQVEDRLVAGREAVADQLFVEAGEEALLVVVGEPVGVGGERGLLRQHRQPREQRGGGVGEQVVDVADAAGAGELERQQRQQPRLGWDDVGAGVAGPCGQGGQVEGGQVGQHEQQPGAGGVQPLRPVGEVEDPGAGQRGVASRRGRVLARVGVRVAQQPAEPFLGEDFGD